MAKIDVEDKILITPATTPGNVENRNSRHTEFLIPQTQGSKTVKWYRKLRPPVVIVSVSVIEILFYVLSSNELKNSLRFEPKKQFEIWRFFTYMLTHDSWQHISLNVFLQCLFAMVLENIEGGIHVLIVYIGGGIWGALGAGCIQPALLVGSSAGVYALLASYLSYFILNYCYMKYTIWKCVGVATIIASDLTYSLVHNYNFKTPVISWGAHIFGALGGFLVGILLYHNNCLTKHTYRALFYTIFLVFLTALTLLVVLDYFQSKKCNWKFLKFKISC